MQSQSVKKDRTSAATRPARTSWLAGWTGISALALGLCSSHGLATTPAGPEQAAQVEEAHLRLRAQVQQRIEEDPRAEGTDPDSLILVSPRNGPLLAGRARRDPQLGAQPWGVLWLASSLADLPAGLYTLRSPPAQASVELLDAEGRVAATLVLDAPPLGGASALPDRWPTHFLGLARSLMRLECDT